ncbi:hypothetical protein [Amycolatopsis sp. Hca4]|uniref:hypothetical protein n=1 Tax=Amycolatopsis sp. Hca4 TaxID=2742131 RepID=UPI001591B034|nr:hypothetical protein [Amycolatopsis sp. Hca4]QKV74949.1 hypothetical protein HUT10_15100 [Amycolatopsis sp. Hca4]
MLTIAYWITQQNESQPNTGGSAAWFTLLGAGVTAIFSLVAVLVKSFTDARSDARKYRYDLEKIAIQTQSDRSENRMKQVRDVNAVFLAETARCYRAIVDARRARRDDQDDEKFRKAIRSISSEGGQVALEEVRLISTQEIIEAADILWSHLRSHDVSTGGDLSSTAWTAWKSEFWRLRHTLIAAVRSFLNSDSPT